MIIYRAMSNEEAEKTINKGKPDFLNRFKWFSHNLDFIKQRVLDGKFNNSNHRPERYVRLLVFEIDSLNSADFISNNEIQYDRRKNPKITYVGELEWNIS